MLRPSHTWFIGLLGCSYFFSDVGTFALTVSSSLGSHRRVYVSLWVELPLWTLGAHELGTKVPRAGGITGHFRHKYKLASKCLKHYYSWWNIIFCKKFVISRIRHWFTRIHAFKFYSGNFSNLKSCFRKTIVNFVTFQSSTFQFLTEMNNSEAQ